MKQKGFTVKQEAGFIPILISIIVAAVALGGAFILWRTVAFNKTQPQNQVVTSTTTNASPATTQPSPTPTPFPVQAETTNWKTYTDSNGFFSLNYPETWIIKYSQPILKNKQDITLSGPEGKLNIFWVNTYGDIGIGCNQIEKIQIDNRSYSACHVSVNPDANPDAYLESWLGITNRFNNKDSLGVSINAYANKPIQTNRQTVLKILQSLHFDSYQP